MLVLRPSRRHGVGVFTTKFIQAGAKLRLFYPDDWKFVQRPRGEELEMCRRHGVRELEGFHCPRFWERMSLGWYLNHSARPNVVIAGLRARALRAVRADEELTVDYSLL